MNNAPRIYTYKITFEEVPYYYYGVHKEKSFNEEYWGSPVTHKWCWILYNPKKQILELFEYSDEGWLEAVNIEYRLIKPVYQTEKWCLNENCGGKTSLKILRDNGIAQFNMKNGIHAQTIEDRIEMGKKIWKDGKGLASLSDEQRKYNAALGGATGAGGKVVGNLMKKQSRGIFALSKNELSKNGKIGAKNTNSQIWKCTITGYTSTSGGLSRYQKSKKIDTINRIKIN